jgi:hypothetical protein
MNTQFSGAQARRRLSFNFGGKHIAKARKHKRAGSELPAHELRRLVAAMVD